MKPSNRHLIFAACLIPFLTAPASSENAARETPKPEDICDYTTPDDVDRATTGSFFKLAACLSHETPDIRDGIGYTVMAEMLRETPPDEDDLRRLKDQLTSMVETADQDAQGFQGPFAILALSEIARTDRVSAWMTSDERVLLAQLGADYLNALTDYRGFNEIDGWRHGVAHTADLFMQLSLSDRASYDEADIMLQAINAKIAPVDGVAYRFGEPERLARPVIFLARSGLMDEDRATDFFRALKPDLRQERWREPYANEAGLIALHNTKAFANSIYLSVMVSETPTDDLLAEQAILLRRALP
ncbi:MAG: hypothetical protein CMK07_03705 [Ponticaulis sp.]|nr:hypothetical protein [Ponticaulis sp.]